MKFYVILALLMLSIDKCIAAESIVVSSLQIPAGVRGAGLCGGATNVSEGAEALYFNPAGIYRVNTHQLLTSHSSWFGGEVYHTSISYAHKLTEYSAVAIGLWGVHAWGIEGVHKERWGIKKYHYDSSEMTLAYGYAHKKQTTALGITTKATFANIDNHHAHAVTLDLGMLREFSPIKVGICVQHLGLIGVKFAQKLYVPAPTMKLAVSFPYINFLFDAELVYLIGAGEINIICGSEYSVNEYFKVRGAIEYNDNRNTLRGAVGCGLKLTEIFLCDYAFSSYDELGATHRFSLLTHIPVKKK